MSTVDKSTWSAQGFGMLRKYLPGNRRLHVWTKAVYVPSVTLLHTHSWDFTSLILRGVIHNFKFNRVPGDPTHNEYRLKCGEKADENVSSRYDGRPI